MNLSSLHIFIALFISLKLKETVMSVLKDAGSSVIGSWRVKTDQEFYNKFKSPGIITVIKVCRVEWVTYVVRLGGKRTVRKLLEAKQKEGEKKEDLG